jgi:hypothetical protein
MRKIENLMLTAINSGQNMSLDNTKVITENNYSSVYLHGSEIATVGPNNVVINDCGYQTKTTKSRLSAIVNTFCKAWLYQKKGQWYLEHKETGETLAIEGNTDYALKRAH